MYNIDNIVGNKKIKDYLKNIINANKIPHAFIFSGDEGMGKTLFAMSFAKTLQCEKMQDSSCDSCISCFTFDSDNNPDIFYIDIENKKSIGIDIVREKINNIIDIKPYRNRYKIFIIKNADSLTIQAQNALLKTIEEPPNYGIFILLSENDKGFLPTILSRCVLLKLNPISDEEILKFLVETEKIDVEIAKTVITFSEGNIGKAIKLVKNENFVMIREKVINLLNGFNKKNVYDVYLIVKELENYKDNILSILDIIYFWFRDILIYIETKDIKYIFDKAIFDLIKKESSYYNLEMLYSNLNEIKIAKQNLKHNGNFQLTLEVMFYNFLDKVNCNNFIFNQHNISN